MQRVLRPHGVVGAEPGGDPAEVGVALGTRGTHGVAVQRLVGGEHLVGLEDRGVAVAGTTAQLGPGEADAGVVLGDGPVRSQGDRGSGLPVVAHAPGTGGTGRTEAPRPVVRAVGLAPLQVERLHRGGDARGREARDVAIGRGLQVLDPVGCPAGAADPGGEVRIDDLPHRAVADGVRGDLEAGLGIAAHGAGVGGGVLPERRGPLPGRVGLVQPSRSRLHHAVGVELDDPAPPALSPAVAHPQVLGRAGGVEPGLVVDGGHNADRQTRPLLHGVQQVQGREAAVHDRAAGETGGPEPLQQFVAGGERLRAVQGGGREAHGLVRAEFAQLAGRDPLGVDHDEGGVVRLARPGDAAAPQPLAAGQRGVPVEHDEERGEAAHRVLDGVRGHGDLVEDVVVEIPSAHPRLGVLGERPVGLGAEGGAQRRGGGDAPEVDPRSELETLQRVQVRVDEPGGDGGAAEVVHDGAGPAQLADEVVVADRQEAPVADGEGRGLRAAGVHRHDARAGDDSVGVETRHDVLPRAN